MSHGYNLNMEKMTQKYVTKQEVDKGHAIGKLFDLKHELE